MKKQNEEIIKLAVEFTRENNNSDFAGFDAIMLKLISTGSVVTTEDTRILGHSCVLDFIEWDIYEGGVGLNEWKFDEDFYNHPIFREYVKAEMELKESEVSRLEKKLEKEQTATLDLLDFLNGKKIN